MAGIFLSVDELADRLGVRRSCVYSWTRQRGPDVIPRMRLGRRYAFDLADVIAWLKDQEAGRTSAVPQSRRRR